MTVRAPEKRDLKIKIWPEGGFPEKAGPREVAVLSCWWEAQGRCVAGRQRAAAAGPEPGGWAAPAGRSPGGSWARPWGDCSLCLPPSAFLQGAG